MPEITITQEMIDDINAISARLDIEPLETIKRLIREKMRTLVVDSPPDLQEAPLQLRGAPPPIKGGWTGKGVTLPEGTRLRMEYRDQYHEGVIENASWVVKGEKYNSPSAAAGGAARTNEGTRPSLNGWKHWWVKRPCDESWLDLGKLRAHDNEKHAVPESNAASETEPEMPADVDRNQSRIEIGDTVRIRYLTHGEEVIQVTISRDGNDIGNGMIGYAMPLAEAVLDAEEGDEIAIPRGSYVRSAIIEKVIKSTTSE